VSLVLLSAQETPYTVELPCLRLHAYFLLCGLRLASSNGFFSGLTSPVADTRAGASAMPFPELSPLRFSVSRGYLDPRRHVHFPFPLSPVRPLWCSAPLDKLLCSRSRLCLVRFCRSTTSPFLIVFFVLFLVFVASLRPRFPPVVLCFPPLLPALFPFCHFPFSPPVPFPLSFSFHPLLDPQLTVVSPPLCLAPTPSCCSPCYAPTIQCRRLAPAFSLVFLSLAYCLPPVIVPLPSRYTSHRVRCCRILQVSSMAFLPPFWPERPPYGPSEHIFFFSSRVVAPFALSLYTPGFSG